MKFITTILLLLCTSCFAQNAPDFHLKQKDLPESLSDLKGSVVYIDFWASWCKPCRKSFPWMNDMQAKYANKGLQILAINLDQDSSLADGFLAKIAANFPVIYDPQGKIAEQYKLVGMPSSYLVDSEGNIRKAHKGFFDKKRSAYEQELIALLNEME
jgi:thiol-disulfide isomerase/thioredoxin